MNKQAVWRTSDRVKVGQQLHDDGLPINEIMAILAAMPGESMKNVRGRNLRNFFASDGSEYRREKKVEPPPIEVQFRDILMQVGPDFPAIDIGKVWPDVLIGDVNAWRMARDMAPVRVVGP